MVNGSTRPKDRYFEIRLDILNRLGNGQAGIEMSASPAAGDDKPGSSHGGLVCEGSAKRQAQFKCRGRPRQFPCGDRLFPPIASDVHQHADEDSKEDDS